MDALFRLGRAGSVLRSGLGRRVVDRLPQRVLQQVDVVDNDVPDAARVGAEVFMHDSVTGSRDGPPGNVRMGSLEFRADLLRGLLMTAME
jgi:hypothetical protein